jgi:hypothetical protein
MSIIHQIECGKAFSLAKDTSAFAFRGFIGYFTRTVSHWDLGQGSFYS